MTRNAVVRCRRDVGRWWSVVLVKGRGEVTVSLTDDPAIAWCDFRDAVRSDKRNRIEIREHLGSCRAGEVVCYRGPASRLQRTQREEKP